MIETASDACLAVIGAALVIGAFILACAGMDNWNWYAASMYVMGVCGVGSIAALGIYLIVKALN